MLRRVHVIGRGSGLEAMGHQDDVWNDYASGKKEYRHRVTPQERKLVMKYVVTGDAKQAALDVGYAESTASTKIYQILERPGVKHLLQKQLTKCEEELGLTKDWKLGKLKTVVDGTIPDFADKIDPIAARAGIAAIAEANKMQGHYAPVQTMNANLNVNTEIDDRQKEELDKVVAEIKQKHIKDY